MRTTKEIYRKKQIKNCKGMQESPFNKGAGTRSVTGGSLKGNKGITLIALVITIIVMLILVAVTINMAINGGLFNYAGKAVADMQNAIDLEQQLANGRILIGGVWYDSIDDYINGIPSGTQTQQDIIITSIIREENGSRYIDLTFRIAGTPTFEEYQNEYVQDGFLDFIDYNVLPEKSIEDMEDVLKDINGNDNGVVGDDDVVITDEIRSGIIEAATYILYQVTETQITLPYEQSLRIYMYYINNSSSSSAENAMNSLAQLAMMNMYYCYFCEVLGLEPCYDATELEKQCVEIGKLLGEEITFDDESRAYFQAQADTAGVTYEMYLKIMLIDSAGDLISVNVTVANRDTFVADLIDPYPYPVTENGTYTFTAELQDGSGRKGETTVVIDDIIDENGWVMAWTYTADDGWSDMIENGEEAEGDIVAKLYKTGNTITPVGGLWSTAMGLTLEAGPEYKLVIEGTGDMGILSSDSGSSVFNAWQKYSVIYSLTGQSVDFYYPAYITSVNICEGITNIGQGAFYDFSSLKSVTIEDTVTTVNDRAFFYCISLENITIPENVIKLGNRVFEDCDSLTNVIIPENVTEIGKGIFACCDKLESVTYLNDIKTITEYMFEHCYSINSEIIPDTVTTIEDGAFNDCKNLTSINIPDSVETLGFGVFEDCTGLESVTIPSKVTKLEGATFRGCTNLKSIIILGNLVEMTYTDFNDISEEVIFYVPSQEVKDLIIEIEGCSEDNVVIK